MIRDKAWNLYGHLYKKVLNFKMAIFADPPTAHQSDSVKFLDSEVEICLE